MMHLPRVAVLSEPTKYLLRNRTHQKWHVVVGLVTLLGNARFKVKKIVRHPDYKLNRLKGDTAIVQVLQSIEDVSNANMMKLPTLKTFPKEGHELIVSGFAPSSEVKIGIASLKRFTSKISKSNICQQEFANYDLNGKFCALTTKNHDYSFGETGSPAAFKKMFIFRIQLTSMEKGRKPKLMTNVTSYLNFIKRAMA